MGALVVVLAAAGALLLTAGDGGGDERGPAATASAAAGSDPADDGIDSSGPPASPAPPSVGDVVWATQLQPETNAPVVQVERFSVDDPTIYAVVAAQRLPAGAELTATWAYNDVPLDGLGQSVVVSTSSAETTWIEFHLTRQEDRSWPDGRYAVAITLDGEPVRTASVEVVEGD
jgi:hypothetical protein